MIKSKMWICDCLSPLSDLMKFSDKTCEVCKKKRPNQLTYNVKYISVNRLTSNAGSKRMSSLTKKQRTELSMKGVLAKQNKNK